MDSRQCSKFFMRNSLTRLLRDRRRLLEISSTTTCRNDLCVMDTVTGSILALSPALLR